MKQKRRHAWKDKHVRKQRSNMTTMLGGAHAKPWQQCYWRARRSGEHQECKKLIMEIMDGYPECMNCDEELGIHSQDCIFIGEYEGNFQYQHKHSVHWLIW